jgi:hypothetical protein
MCRLPLFKGNNILDSHFPWQGGLRLISLWDMKEYLAKTILDIEDSLKWSLDLAGGETIDATGRGLIAQRLTFVQNQGIVLGFVSTVRGTTPLKKENAFDSAQNLQCADIVVRALDVHS